MLTELNKVNALLFRIALFVCIFGVLVFCIEELKANDSLETNTKVSQYIPSFPSLAPLAEKVNPFVVTISSTKIFRIEQNTYYQGPFIDPMFRRFFGMPEPEPRYKEFEEKGLGSGVIISSDGYIVTNAHVVEGADEVIVRFDDKKYEAKIIGSDKRTDIAVLKIEEENLPYATFADSDKMRVGDWVLAIGSPFELEHTITMGIISAKSRSNVGITDYEDFIQTDASINPGNSGGALVNLNAELLGINTAIASQTGGNMGIGFAIPSNMVKTVSEQLINKGHYSRGWLGINIQQITQDISEAFHLQSKKGVLISNVIANSPADKAGLLEGDVILSLDGVELNNSADLRNKIYLSKPGTQVKLVVLRNNSKMTFDINIGILPDDIDGNDEYSNVNSNTIETGLGVTVEKITNALRREYNLNRNVQGVVITSLEMNSPLLLAGIQEGDIILEVNRTRINDEPSFRESMNLLAQGDIALFQIQRDNNRFYIAVRIG